MISWDEVDDGRFMALVEADEEVVGEAMEEDDGGSTNNNYE
jgi:hypothetical protein